MEAEYEDSVQLIGQKSTDTEVIADKTTDKPSEGTDKPADRTDKPDSGGKGNLNVAVLHVHYTYELCQGLYRTRECTIYTFLYVTIHYINSTKMYCTISLLWTYRTQSSYISG